MRECIERCPSATSLPCAHTRTDASKIKTTPCVPVQHGLASQSVNRHISSSPLFLTPPSPPPPPPPPSSSAWDGFTTRQSTPGHTSSVGSTSSPSSPHSSQPHSLLRTEEHGGSNTAGRVDVHLCLSMQFQGSCAWEQAPDITFSRAWEGAQEMFFDSFLHQSSCAYWVLARECVCAHSVFYLSLSLSLFLLTRYCAGTHTMAGSVRTIQAS